MELFLLVVVVVVVFPILPYPFIANPSSAAAEGGNLLTQYDGGGRYGTSPSIIQHVRYLPQCASDGRCLYGQP